MTTPRILLQTLLSAGVAVAAGCTTVTPASPLKPPVVLEEKKVVEEPVVELVSSLDAAKVVTAPAATELTVSDLVENVLSRNPTIDQMRAAAEALQARYPQVTALDDPMFSFNAAPASAWSPNADFAARAEVSQKIPWSGKRGLRGESARAEAAAALRDVDDARLQLAEAAQAAFADYYLATKALEVNAENTRLLKEYRSNAETRYRSGQGPQQDLLAADVELAKQQERAIQLRRARSVAMAKINTLMHRPPDTLLPPPAAWSNPAEVPEVTELREQAMANRPDLKAIADRLAGDEAALALAEREFKPDVELLAAYDGFWQGANGRPLQWQVGARINLPVQKDRRRAAVAEAQARISQRRAELAKVSDQVLFQVQEAAEQLAESTKVVELYEKTVLPAAVANVKEAQASYVSGKIPFLNLVEAQRNQVSLRDRYYEAQAEVLRRRGAVERAVGVVR